MALILHVPALQAHSTLRYADWRGVVARFTARQLGLPEDDLRPQLVGHVALAAAVAAYERWLADDDADLGVLLADAFGQLHLRFLSPAARGGA
jgi:TetR/AcrR family transcriptional regulator, regulator of mycofactocin system